jgi:hypothetical protein
MRTNRLLSLLLLGCTVLPLSRCTNDSTGPLTPQSANGKSVSVSFSIRTNKAFTTIARSASVMISAPDMDTIRAPMVITDSMLQGTVANIPLGTSRKFEIEVRDSAGALCYYGSQSVDLLSSQTTYVLISLRRTSGSVVIIGVIEDDSSWNNHGYVERPHSILALNTKVSDIDTAAFWFTIHGSYCSDMDPVEHRLMLWEYVARSFPDTLRIGLPDVMDTVIDSLCLPWWGDSLNYPLWPHLLKAGRSYQIYAQARDALHPDRVSYPAYMGQLDCITPFEISITYSTLDTVIPIDTVPPVWDSTWVDTLWVPPVDTFPPWRDTVIVYDTIQNHRDTIIIRQRN